MRANRNGYPNDFSVTMIVKTLSILVTLSLATVSAQHHLGVDTPQSASQCQPLKISWYGGQPPYNPKIMETGNSSVPTHVCNQTSETDFSWKPTMKAGQNFTIHVTDSAGASAVSDPVQVSKGSTECLDDDEGENSNGSSPDGEGSSDCPFASSEGVGPVATGLSASGSPGQSSSALSSGSSHRLSSAPSPSGGMRTMYPSNSM